MLCQAYQGRDLQVKEANKSCFICFILFHALQVKKAPLLLNGANHRDLRCVLHSLSRVLWGCKTLRAAVPGSVIKTFNPHCTYDVYDVRADRDAYKDGDKDGDKDAYKDVVDMLRVGEKTA